MSLYPWSTVFIKDRTGVIPLPAAKKKMLLNDRIFSGSLKNPDTPDVISVSPGAAVSISFREKKPLSIRFTPMANGSFIRGDETIE